MERDFENVGSLSGYLVTPPIANVFGRIADGLRPRSSNRAWRITGDYGTGKSSLALVLAHVLRDPTDPAVRVIRKALGKEFGRAIGVSLKRPILPVLVTGDRQPVVPSVALAIRRTVERQYGRRRPRRALELLVRQANEVAASSDATALLRLIEELGRRAMPDGPCGVLLVLDELGKFLEYAAMDPERQDVYVLQRLGEAAARSGNTPLIVVGLLHQGFHAYAERLPSTVRLEWEKVSGRFEDVAIDQPLGHAAALVAGALDVDFSRVPASVGAAGNAIRASVASIGWYGSTGEGLNPTSMYPLHPTVLPVLVRFFARFGQHERSLFSFLLSGEPGALQEFADGLAHERAWYRLSHFYDYVRAVFGHRLAGASHLSNWLRIAGTIDRAVGSDLSSAELDLLKAVAVLNVIDSEQLLATGEVLSVALADAVASPTVRRSVMALKRRGLLFDRGAAGGYCLWPSTSLNLQNALDRAERALGPVEMITAELGPYLDRGALVARRHYIASGTLRYFETRYVPAANLRESLAETTEADGVVVIALCATEGDCDEAKRQARSAEAAETRNTLVGVSRPLQDLAPELQDARCWQWISDNTPELAQDTYAAAEVARKVAATTRALRTRLVRHFGLAAGRGGAVSWWRGGQQVVMPERGGLSAALSEICDELFDQAPLVRNELLNRRSLSSAAAAARLRLIDRMFAASNIRELGMDTTKAPPERSMYLSVLAEGGVHRADGETFLLGEPDESADPLRLRPALARITAMLEAAGDHRVPVVDIHRTLAGRPFGIRDGVAPLLLAIVVVSHAHELAVYEEGSFLPRFASSDFLRLTKQPGLFELQLCRVSGVRLEVFTELARFFAQDHPSRARPELLDVVRPLSVFAAGLPEYTRRGRELCESSRLVRDALLSARDPALLVFRDLPVACGMAPVTEGGESNTIDARLYASRLRDAVDELRSTYPLLLQHVRDRTLGGLTRRGDSAPTREEVGQRARRLALAIREPRLHAFARSLSDLTLSDDGWAERIGSFVASRPPSQWSTDQKITAFEELERLTASLTRVEDTAFWNGGLVPDGAAIRLAVTGADGTESSRVVTIRPQEEESVAEMVRRLEHAVDGAATTETSRLTEVGLAAIARFLRSWMPTDEVAN